jgi:hypothetical protein
MVAVLALDRRGLRGRFGPPARGKEATRTARVFQGRGLRTIRTLSRSSTAAQRWSGAQALRTTRFHWAAGRSRGRAEIKGATLHHFGDSRFAEFRRGGRAPELRTRSVLERIGRFGRSTRLVRRGRFKLVPKLTETPAPSDAKAALLQE